MLSTAGKIVSSCFVGSCANADDPTVQVERNGEGTSSYFSFNTFEFTGSSGDVYLHCQLHLCVKEDGNCVPVRLCTVLSNMNV